MRYCSTKQPHLQVSLAEAIRTGVASDGGLYMPLQIRKIPEVVVRNFGGMSLHDLGFLAATTLLGDDIDAATLKQIVQHTLSYDIPLKPITPNISILELFHGPTMAFKDLGARFMARLLAHFNRTHGAGMLDVLVVTSGDSGSAVANGFLDLEGVRVHVLYPKGSLTRLQESQFTTLGGNVNAIEVSGSIDNCLALVRAAFADLELTRKVNITSANSINIGRLLPQVIHYFQAVAQLQRKGVGGEYVAVVPSGNLGNLTAAVVAKRMGLPFKRFISAHNANDTFPRLLATGQLLTRQTVRTIAPSMDKGDPTNLPRLMQLYNGSIDLLRHDISAIAYSDRQIASTITDTLLRHDCLLDPHSATAFRAATELLQPSEVGVVAATAHPAKFKQAVEHITGQAMAVPPTLAKFLHSQRQRLQLPPTYSAFKHYLLSLG